MSDTERLRLADGYGQLDDESKQIIDWIISLAKYKQGQRGKPRGKLGQALRRITTLETERDKWRDLYDERRERLAEWRQRAHNNRADTVTANAETAKWKERAEKAEADLVKLNKWADQATRDVIGTDAVVDWDADKAEIVRLREQLRTRTPAVVSERLPTSGSAYYSKSRNGVAHILDKFGAPLCGTSHTRDSVLIQTSDDPNCGSCERMMFNAPPEEAK